MRALRLLPMVAWLALAVRASAQAAPTVPSPDTAVLAAADSAAARGLWPGFDPRATPVAIFDGERTLLFRHPSPPEGFTPVAGAPGVRAYRGRFPAVSANSSTEIGGVATATLMPAAPGTTVRARAGVLLHEAFHVYQRAHHPGWSANEAALFTYPAADSTALALRRAETAALARALGTRAPAARVCWARAALRARRARFARMPAEAARYETATEWNEGLANYIQMRATDAPDTAIIDAHGYAPARIRQRAYASGTALGRLLDGVLPAWRDTLERRDTVTLDALLESALARATPDEAPCALPAAELAQLQARAARDVAALAGEREERRRAFLAQPGWTVTIDAAAAPLFPKGFDPLNVELVRAGEVLHGRWIELGNDHGTAEVLGRAALTVAAGDHPLFSGARSLVVAGLPAEPALTVTGDAVRLTAEGLSIDLHGASVEREGQAITIHLR